MAQIFQKSYDGESIVDLGRDIFEALDPRFNEPAAVIPSDEHGFSLGTFKVTIEWTPEGGIQ